MPNEMFNNHMERCHHNDLMQYLDLQGPRQTNICGGKKQDVQMNIRRMCIHFTLFGTSMQFNNPILVCF